MPRKSTVASARCSPTTRHSTLAVLVCLLGLAACAPEVGSEAWCEDMKEKPKGEWTANEAAEFAKSCLLR